MTAMHVYLWSGSAWMVLCLVRHLSAPVPKLLRVIIGIIGGLMWGVAAAPFVADWKMPSSPETMVLGLAVFLALALSMQHWPRHCR